MIISNPAIPHYFPRLDWQDGLFDCCWSETSPNIIASSSADGSIQIWDIFAQQQVIIHTDMYVVMKKKQLS